MIDGISLISPSPASVAVSACVGNPSAAEASLRVSCSRPLASAIFTSTPPSLIASPEKAIRPSRRIL